MTETCRNCKYSRKVLGDEECGECHRWPPKVSRIGEVLAPSCVNTYFPKVNLSEYCGEWK